MRSLFRFPPVERHAVMVEGKVTLHGCTLIGHVRVGWRSYANDSVLRNVRLGRFSSVGRHCSIGIPLVDMGGFSMHPALASADFERDPMTKLGNDVHLGDAVTVAAGVTIGDGAIVAPGSHVNEDVAPFAILAGNPARVVGYRFTPGERAALSEARWWRYGEQVLEIVPVGASAAQLLAALAKTGLPDQPVHYRAWRAR